MGTGPALILPHETGHSRDRYQRIHSASVAQNTTSSLPHIRGLNGPIFSRMHCGGANANGWIFKPPPTPMQTGLSQRTAQQYGRTTLEPLYPYPGHSTEAAKASHSAAPLGSTKRRTQSGAQYMMTIDSVNLHRLRQP